MFARTQELMDALMVTLGLAEGRMEMWALNGNPFEEGDDTNAGVPLHVSVGSGPSATILTPIKRNAPISRVKNQR